MGTDRAREQWFADNSANWDQRADVHVSSPGYPLEEFIRDRSKISHVIRYDQPDLGDLNGIRGVHLQCHLGTDTISLARLGAMMTGIDLSSRSVELANDFARRTGDRAQFVTANVYDAVSAVSVNQAADFDLVYTGGGALCWLPDIAAWARVCADLLAPGGRLHVRDFHPVFLALADGDDPELRLEYPYFEQPEPTTWDGADTYVDGGDGAPSITATTSHEWNHGIAEIVTAVMDAGLHLTLLREDRTSPWAKLGSAMVDVAGLEHEYELADRPERLPATFTLQATKPR